MKIGMIIAKERGKHMAQYIVEPTKKTYEKNYKMPMVNLFAGIIWSIPLHQKLFPDAGWWVTFGLCAVFVIVYVALSYIPFAVLIPGIASVIIYTGLFWVFPDKIDHTVVRIALKVLIAVFFGFMELAVFANAMVPWMESREARKPNIRVIK